MWKPYLKIIAQKASQAIHILDRFHIAQHMNKAIDKVRALEARELRQGRGCSHKFPMVSALEA
jgi:transposase